ncbi:uncharacterized protein V1510DRAFT_421146 [Dipodascopsis tothii]|uniref:uncharacterized protein n=1 Tax=Dipodascopsis tothii TaxID=44089 RepID=UPI0034CE3827
MSTPNLGDTSSVIDANPTELSVAEKARLRRERREAKILAGGSARLDKITQTAHGENSIAYKKHNVSRPSIPDFSDPDVSDLASLGPLSSNVSTKSPDALSSDELFSKSPTDLLQDLTNGSTPTDGDMFELLLKQLGEGAQQKDPQTAALIQDMYTSAAGTKNNLPDAVKNYNATWKSMHSFLIVLLAAWTIYSTGLEGSKLTRTDESKNMIFWYFSTIELGLQSSRFILEKGRLPPGSEFRLSKYLPDPYSTYLNLLARYSFMISHVITDFCLLIFLLGINAWWKW